MRKYPEYKIKDGNYWFDSVPFDWDIIALKHITYSVKTGSTPSTKERKYYEEGEIDWYTPEDISSLILSDSKKKITRLAIQDGELKLFKANSLLLVGIGATIGKVGLLTKDATSNQQINSVFFNKKLTPKYGLYFFYSIAKIMNEFSSTSTMGIFNQSKTKAIYVPVPPHQEQNAITHYLDYKTGQIDSFIANRQKQIELLKEQKAGIINKAVTKGINPNAKMKDSGIEWIGEVPEHWKKMRLKNISRRITNGFVGSTSDILKETGVRYIQALHVKQNTIIFNQPYFVSEKWSNEHPRSILKKGDLVITQTGAMTGDVGLVPIEFEGCNCHALIIVKPNIKKVIPEFILFILSSHFGKSLLESIRTGSMHPHLNSTIVCDINISLPVDLLEQKSILDFIKSETSTVDTLISKYQKQIDLMQEYRTSLISQAVTGKIDVREWEPKREAV